MSPSPLPLSLSDRVRDLHPSPIREILAVVSRPDCVLYDEPLFLPPAVATHRVPGVFPF